MGKKSATLLFVIRADVFDMYWDKYRKDLKSIEWTDGTVSARLWGHKAKESKKKR